GVLSNAPSFDTVCLLSHDVTTPTHSAALECDGWRGHAEQRPDRHPVLGIPDGPYLELATAEARLAYARHVERLRETGYAVRPIPALTDIADVIQRNNLINLVELARTHESWFATYEDRYREQSATAIREGQRIAPEAYERALTERKEYAAALVAQMDAEGVDAWVAPAATGPAPAGLDTTGSPLMNLPWTQARLPVVGVPAGVAANGLPLGVQFAGRPGADEELLRWAADLGHTLAT
ncbi:MAG: amidase family protein, partial [Actinopolymorphaceae bacterium]